MVGQTNELMPDVLRSFLPFAGDGNEWEALIHQLLVIRHGSANYVMVPAKHGGDWGIDGYSYDGNVYQCYAAENCTTDELYQKQRNKLTVDIGKFIENRRHIGIALGPARVSRWCFVVPFYSSSKLVAHAAQKTREVQQAGLPYVANDFNVHLDPLQNYRNELLQFIASSTGALFIRPPEISDSALLQFHDSQSEWIANPKRKLSTQTSSQNAGLGMTRFPGHSLSAVERQIGCHDQATTYLQ